MTELEMYNLRADIRELRAETAALRERVKELEEAR